MIAEDGERWRFQGEAPQHCRIPTGVKAGRAGNKVAGEANKVRVTFDRHFNRALDERLRNGARGMKIAQMNQLDGLAEIGDWAFASGELQPGRLDKPGVCGGRCAQDRQSQKYASRSALCHKVL